MADDYKLLMSILARNMTEGGDERNVPPPAVPSPDKKSFLGKYF